MREIKFRVWNKRINELSGCDDIYFCQEPLNEAFKLDEYVFMQYTGLKDANGKEIYQGDILEETITDPQNGDELPYRKFLVFWAENYASFALKDLLNEGNYQETMWDIVGLKIVGNICENPELLEREK